LQQNSDITHYLITQFAGLVILAIVMIAFILIIQKAIVKLTNQIHSASSELDIMNSQISENQKMLVSVFTQNDKFTSEFLEINKKLTSIHQELSLLSSDYSDNKQVTHAIELARKGSSTKIIVEQTGLSSEDAEAIVRFHGQN
jgi:uncharacterized coiled-coil DUF342 family protein|tara:strand:+ start:878 stop:1306 length:429 start_codon:yes stop_codon:yes gene_type:complete